MAQDLAGIALKQNLKAFKAKSDFNNAENDLMKSFFESTIISYAGFNEANNIIQVVEQSDLSYEEKQSYLNQAEQIRTIVSESNEETAQRVVDYYKDRIFPNPYKNLTANDIQVVMDVSYQIKKK